MKRSPRENWLTRICYRTQQATYVVICVCWCLIVLVGNISAAEIELDIEGGIGHSDNIAREQSGSEQQETFYSLGLNFGLDEQTRKFQARAAGDLLLVNYDSNIYPTQLIGGLDIFGVYRITDETVSWFVQNNFGQQTIDPFQVITPDNMEHVNYLSTGPRLNIPLSSRFALGMEARYSNVRYQELPLNNERLGAFLGLNRQITSTRRASVNVSAEQVEYESQAVNPDVDYQSAFLRIESEGSRNQLNLDLGWTRVEQSVQKDSGPLLQIEWTRQISQVSEMLLNLGTRYTDDANSFRYNQGLGDDLGGTQDQQSTSNPFKENYSDLIMSINKARSRLSLGVGYSDQEYLQQRELDRRLATTTLAASRDLTRSITAGVSAHWSQREYENIEWKDDSIELHASVEWQIKRTIRAVGRIEHIDQDSNIPTYVFKEMRGYLGVIYTPELQ